MRQYLIDFAMWRADCCLQRRQFWHRVARWLNGTSHFHNGGSNG
jgi:hypothetical protein